MHLIASLKSDHVTSSADWKTYQDHSHNFCTKKFKNVLNNNIQNGDVPQQLIISIVTTSGGHFVVACFVISVNAPELFMSIFFRLSAGLSKEDSLVQ
jgi:hypothetical protein